MNDFPIYPEFYITTYRERGTRMEKDVVVHMATIHRYKHTNNKYYLYYGRYSKKLESPTQHNMFDAISDLNIMSYEFQKTMKLTKENKSDFKLDLNQNA